MENEAVAALVSIYVVIVVAAFINISEGGSFCEPPDPDTKYTLSSDQFERALDQEIDGWLIRNVRCTYESFRQVVYEVQLKWHAVHGSSPPTSRPGQLTTQKKIPLCMHYLACGGTMESVSVTFGVSKTRGVIGINQVLQVLAAMTPTKLVFDRSKSNLEQQAQAFEQICGFPGVVGAIDGTLIRVARPSEFEGWYCRKGYPAVNVQAVVVAQMRFISCSIRPGSSNDQSLWNRSGIRDIILSGLPERFHFLGDSGYKLWNHLMTPYAEREALQCPRTSLFNYSHSRTRIIVERAFGVMKNRWRILLRKVDQKTEANIANVIFGCMVLHNILIELRDTVEIDEETTELDMEDNEEAANIQQQPEGESPSNHENGKKKINVIRTFLFAAD